ncbi:alpha/beta fold hydrolase [Nocardioides terrisoli]|uniref:alpha/beta fold hydrolase n=1 Tax=Nocardioides terrisoli TaxID=3388267 RepID=UPI00287B70B6|nr:alpha/beta hydrolase [Nocardioides marmorisolisilvae]
MNAQQTAQRIALDLPDGRVLDVRVSGPEDGIPFVWHHGTPGCNYQPPDKTRVLVEHGLRYVSYSRAGAAGSSRNPGRTVASIAEDVAAIADHLGADKILTGGGSGGGPHALATGAGLPDRVLAVLAVCCVKPYAGQDDFLEGMGADNVEEFTLALQGEDALMPFLLSHREGIIAGDADSVLRTLDTLLPEVDRAVLTGEVGEDLIRNLQGGVEEVYGWLDDDLAFTRHWGFELDDLAVPTYLWQGTEDLMVPFHHGQWLAEHLPGVVPHLEQGEGHLSIVVAKFPEMIEELVAHLPR